MAAGSAFSFGVTIVINRSLAQTDLGVSTVLGWRFSVAALVLVVVLAAARLPLVPAPGERARVFLLGFAGYAFEATLFFMGLERGTAAAVSLLFYTYPAMVMLLEIGLGVDRPNRRSLLALGLSAGGSALVVVAGGDVSISTAGVAFSLASAAAVTVYLVATARLVRVTGALTTGAWTAFGAAVSFLGRAVATGALHGPSGHVLPLLGNGVATASAFVLMFAAIRRIGATQAAVVMTLEAFFAIVLAAGFLGEGIKALQGVGGAAILAATGLVAMRRRGTTPAAPT